MGWVKAENMNSGLMILLPWPFCFVCAVESSVSFNHDLKTVTIRIMENLPVGAVIT